MRRIVVWTSGCGWTQTLGQRAQLLCHNPGHQGRDEGTFGEEDEVLLDFGPGGRVGVCHLDGGAETEMARKLRAPDGRFALEQEEPSTEQVSALLRRVTLGGSPYADFSVWLPFGKKAHRAQKYRSYQPVMGGVHRKGNPRARFVRPMASQLSGLQDGAPHARHPDDGYVRGIRGPHRETGPALSGGLALDCGGRRLGTIGTFDQASGVCQPRHRQRHEGSIRVDGGEPLGGAVQNLGEGRHVLVRAGSRTRQCVVGPWVEGETFDALRGSGSVNVNDPGRDPAKPELYDTKD